MAFSKAFPKRSDKTFYPRWEDVTLTEEEEKLVEQVAKTENMSLMKDCIEDAKKNI